MSNIIATDQNGSRVLKERIYRIGGDHFVMDHLSFEHLTQSEFYQRYCVALSHEPHLAFVSILRDAEKYEDERSADDKEPADVSRLMHDQDKLRGSILLEGYFNDLYKLFLRKLATFDCQSAVIEEDKKKLRSLLEELIKVKGMLCGNVTGTKN